MFQRSPAMCSSQGAVDHLTKAQLQAANTDAPVGLGTWTEGRDWPKGRTVGAETVVGGMG